jgi:hypothetical protein
MENAKPNRLYLIVVLLTMLVLPVLSIGITYYYDKALSNLAPLQALRGLIIVWLVFWGIGIRLVTAGLRQILKPAFTAETIFKLRSAESHIVIRELGFANLTLGLMAGTSLFFPSWQLPAACMGIFFYGVAGIQHVIKRPVTANQWIALVSDLYISIVLLACLVA